MRSFSTLSLIATLALSAFTSAAPSPILLETSVQAQVVPTPTVLEARTVKCLPDILTEITTGCSEHLTKLTSLSASDCTSDNISPIAVDIQAVLATALVDVRGLSGQSAKVVFGADLNYLVLINFCHTLSSCVLTFFAAFAACLRVSITAGTSVAIKAILGDICVHLATFVQLVTELKGCEGVSAIIYPLVSGSLSITSSLGVSTCFSFLTSFSFSA